MASQFMMIYFFISVKPASLIGKAIRGMITEYFCSYFFGTSNCIAFGITVIFVGNESSSASPSRCTKLEEA
jgi:hypothetical protein